MDDEKEEASSPMTLMGKPIYFVAIDHNGERHLCKTLEFAKKVEFEGMKKWFGHGEVDVDLMLRMGVLGKERLIEICINLINSPWYKEYVNLIE